MNLTRRNSYLQKVLPSQNPPAGLSPNQVPQFVAWTFDDNGKSGCLGSGTIGGMQFIIDLFDSYKNNVGAGNIKTFDGNLPRGTFFAVGSYTGVNNPWENGCFVKKSWKIAHDKGHELGNHTYTHTHGAEHTFSIDDWLTEQQKCESVLCSPFNPHENQDTLNELWGIGIDSTQIVGFRAPYLGYNNAMYASLLQQGYIYDCSIVEGLQEGLDGRNLLWPYTLDIGSPADNLIASNIASNIDSTPIASYPGLWELAIQVVIVPPDSECKKYGCAPGLRERLKKRAPSFDCVSGKTEGVDWNMWVSLQMTKGEFIATYKYTLDLRLEGNRSPLIICLHSDLYADNYDTPLPNASAEDRRNGLAECMAYTVSFAETRMVTMINLVKWLENPAPL